MTQNLFNSNQRREGFLQRTRRRHAVAEQLIDEDQASTWKLNWINDKSLNKVRDLLNIVVFIRYKSLGGNPDEMMGKLEDVEYEYHEKEYGEFNENNDKA